MHTQPLVFRLYFTSESDAQAAQRQLGSDDIRPDYIKAFGSNEPAKWKLIFTASDVFRAKDALKTLDVKPVQLDYFDPNASWSEEFKPVPLDEVT